jgi:hypothetical protein
MTEKFRDGEATKLHYDFHESTGASRLFLVPSRSRAQRHTPPTSVLNRIFVVAPLHAWLLMYSYFSSIHRKT